MPNDLSASEYCRDFFAEENIEFRFRYAMMIDKLVEDNDDALVKKAINRISSIITRATERNKEEAVTEFFNKLGGTVHNLTLPEWQQAQNKLAGYIKSKYGNIRKDEIEANVQHLVGVLQEHCGDDKEIMKRELSEATKLVYQSSDYVQLLNDIEARFQFLNNI